MKKGVKNRLVLVVVADWLTGQKGIFFHYHWRHRLKEVVKHFLRHFKKLIVLCRLIYTGYNVFPIVACHNLNLFYCCLIV